MSSLWWPGDHRAGDLMSDPALLRALVQVEQAWLRVLAATGIAPAEAAHDLAGLVDEGDLEGVVRASDSGGNPVIPLVALLRGRLAETPGRWLHRGLTSQDVLDSAVMLCARDAVASLRREAARQVDVLAGLADTHRSTRMVARTLTQHAVPTTFGAKAASWLHGLLDADDDLAASSFPAQLGGAAGTLSGLVELGGTAAARSCRAQLPAELGLVPAVPWHTDRAPVTRVADAVTRLTDAWGRLARDVLTLSRPEIGELADPTAGGSSTMPHKANPTAAVLVRRAALATPQLAATLHLAAAEQVDERADGAWHVEWQTLATLLRRAVVAASHTTELLTGLDVRAERMQARLVDVTEAVRSEQRMMADLAGHDPRGPYDGLVDDLVDEVLHRAEGHRARRVTQREERR